MNNQKQIQESECMLKSEWKGCCCECEYQSTVYKHPWNINEYAKGSIKEIMGYICKIPYDKGSIFMDRKHSFCEEFKRKDV